MIRIICEKRHHLGKADISYPVVFCDLCDKRIVDAKKAGYYWHHPLEKEDGSKFAEDGDEYYEVRNEVFFFHHVCAQRLINVARSHGVQQSIELPDGRVFVDSSWMPLDHFPFFLGRNLGVKLNVRKKDDPTEWLRGMV